MAVSALVLVGAKIQLALFAVFCTYASIRLSGIISVALSSIGVTTTVFLAIMVSTLAEFSSRSVAIHRVLQNVTVESDHGQGGVERKMMAKSVGALGEIRINVGNLYFIDKVVVLLLLRAVTETTVNFLLVTA